jgi:ankyrin repeat protein
VNKSIPTRTLPGRSDLGQLRRQAKELRAAFLRGEPAASAEVNEHYHGADPSTFALHDAQLVLARAYGFESWPKLKAHVDGVTLERLCDAVTRHDLKRARGMLKLRPELAKLSLPGGSALHFAVFSRSPEMVGLLLENGADPNQGIWPHREATTPFIMAKERGYAEIVQLIREAERRHPAMETPHDPSAWPAELIAAAGARDESGMIAFLEQHPEYINVPYYLMAPLHCAAVEPAPRLLHWLLDHGADPNLRDQSGPSPLELVGYLNRDPQLTQQIAQTLLSCGAEMTTRAAVLQGDADWIRGRHAEGKLEVGLPKKQGYRGLLEIAVHSGRIDMLELLLELGLDPDEPVQDADGKEHRRGGPLALCAKTKQVQMAEALLACGATLTPPIAVWLGKSEWLRAQHAAGKLDYPLTSDDGLLTRAVNHRRPEVVKLLLDLGLDPNERHRVAENRYSWGAPLRACVKHTDLDAARLLLDRGADPNGQDSYFGSPVYTAYLDKNTAMIELLESRGGHLNAAEAGYAGQTEIARKMLAGELEPHAEEAQYGGTSMLDQLLATGANSGTPEIVRMALERIDWPRGDARWYWPLSNTLPPNERWSDDVRDRYHACFRLILDHSGPNLRSDQGQTILHDVIARDFGDGPGEGVIMATMLLDAGARTDVRDHLLKSTPLGWACRWGRRQIAKLLLERGADPVESDAEPWATPRAWAEKNQNSEMLALLAGYRDRATRE